MYNLQDLVVYCSHGVCRIEQIEERIVDKKPVSYYVLSPVASEKTKFYVPMHNTAALRKMRYLLSKEEMLQILRDPALREEGWISSDNLRKNRYKELLSGIDFFAMAQMVCNLKRYQQEQIAQGKRFHQADESFLRDAQKVLASEMAAVLQVPASALLEKVAELICT